MQAVKRPRSPGLNGNTKPAAAVIYISDDDEDPPPPKRQRSQPSESNGHQNAKSSPISNIANGSASPSQPKRPSLGMPVLDKKLLQPDKKYVPSSSLEESQPNKAGWWVAPNSVRYDRKPGNTQGTQRLHQTETNRSQMSKSVNTPSTSSKIIDLTDCNDDVDAPAPGSTNFSMPTAEPLRFDPVSGHVSPAATIPGESADGPNNYKTPNLQHPGPASFVDLPRISSSLSQPVKPIVTSNIKVNLPVRPSPTPSHAQPPSTDRSSQSWPSRFTVKSSLVVNIPPSKEKSKERARLEMIEVLKKDTEFVKNNALEVERVIGLTGFSTDFLKDPKEDRFKQVAQPKKRVIDRKAIKLPLLGSKGKDVELNKFKVVHPREQVKAILTDRFGEQFDPPITFSNQTNDHRLNGKFQFISDYIIRKNVRAADIGSGLSGCQCTGSCDLTCSCLTKTLDDNTSKGVEQVQSYERRPDGRTVLTNSYIELYAKHAEISECSDCCLCPPTCTNRVVQRGRTVPLEVFETKRRGFGVRSSVNIVRGQFIELYLGEVITESELKRREEAKEEGASSYIYSLDWFPAQSHYHVDGENFGSAMRFVNHSCEPNAKTFTVLNPERFAKQIHYVAFFAIKDIKAGDEITIDYCPQEAGKSYDKNAVEDDNNIVECLCGSKECRRTFWRPGKERNTRKKIIGREN